VGKLVGRSTKGVGGDIVRYLTEVCKHFNVNIWVTSGYRSPRGQAQAMFNNWIRLRRGRVYSRRTLPEADRKKLDEHYRLARETRDATASERRTSRKAFLDLAEKKVGRKSRHSTGRAVDVAQAGMTPKVYKAITLYLREVPEGRKDIYHFESRTRVPAVTDAIRAKWGK